VQFSQPIIYFASDLVISEPLITRRVANQQPSERRVGGRFTTQPPGPWKTLVQRLAENDDL